MKFSTWLEDTGRNLSGGQRQRLLLARALYRNPCLLFLDEATSHLDVMIEQQINHNLASLNITRIVIAHRPQTIAMAEQIFLLRDGVLRPVERQQPPPQFHVGETL
jgi:ATP-binding cassette subfamily B protein RaxB